MGEIDKIIKRETMEIKIKLKIKDVEIELTKDEAKDLRDVLNGLVGEKVIEKIIEEHHHHYGSYPHYPYPIYIEKYRWEPFTPYWTCGTGDNVDSPAITYQTNVSDNMQVSFSVS